MVEWGKHQAGVKQEMLLWLEEHRLLVREALQGVLEHIRVMEISSEVFAREVEPAGLLPMEITLAHHRNNSMHGGSGHGSDGDITSPRGGVQKPFADSAILGGQEQWQLQILKWYISRHTAMPYMC